MQRILVATDFSTRSDRALRRATLLAQAHGAELLIVHAVDEDAGPPVVERRRREAAVTLESLAATVVKADGVPCRPIVAGGQAPSKIAALAADSDADLIVVGPPRREFLRNLVLGTTAKRAAQAGGVPVILAAGVPKGDYAQVLLATDFSDDAARAAQAARRLGLLDRARVAAFHAYDAPAQGLMRRSAMTMSELKDYLAEEAATKRRELAAFLNRAGVSAHEELVELIELSTAEEIRSAARRVRADLVVLGAHGRGAVQALVLGSVTADLILSADVDLLVTP